MPVLCHWQANRVCDAPGSWYCVGQYPPALGELMLKKKAFKQVTAGLIRRP